MKFLVLVGPSSTAVQARTEESGSQALSRSVTSLMNSGIWPLKTGWSVAEEFKEEYGRNRCLLYLFFSSNNITLVTPRTGLDRKLSNSLPKISTLPFQYSFQQCFCLLVFGSTAWFSLQENGEKTSCTFGGSRNDLLFYF